MGMLSRGFDRYSYFLCLCCKRTPPQSRLGSQEGNGALRSRQKQQLAFSGDRGEQALLFVKLVLKRNLLYAFCSRRFAYIGITAFVNSYKG